MRRTDREENRNPDRGIGSGKAAITEKQRDVAVETLHMPRHWQGSGARGEAPGQPVPTPDKREPARGNQYGRAGRLASEQVHEELSEPERQPAPQTRDNEQLPKRAGEKPGELPTPDEAE